MQYAQDISWIGRQQLQSCHGNNQIYHPRELSKGDLNNDQNLRDKQRKQRLGEVQIPRLHTAHTKCYQLTKPTSTSGIQQPK